MVWQDRPGGDVGLAVALEEILDIEQPDPPAATAPRAARRAALVKGEPLMKELMEWLRVQLDKDERIARAACWDEQSDVWTARPPRDRYARYTVVDYLDDGVVVVTPENADDDGVGRHVAEWDPARVMREIDAKRGALAQYTAAVDRMDQAMRDDDTAAYRAARVEAQALQPVIRRDAAVYSERPGYREEWRP